MAIKTVKKIVVAGGEVLGSQIAFQSAYTGHDVMIWLRSSESIKRTEVKLATLYHKLFVIYINFSVFFVPLC